MNFKHNSLSYLLIAILIGVFSTSCKKEEGLGGKATIRGVLKERIYDKDFKVLQSEDVASDKDVFILFGDNETIGEDTKTSATGTFEFNYLMPGKYKVYIYSEDSANNNTTDNLPVIKEVNISKDDKTIDIGELIRYKTIDYDDGTSMASGIVRANYYSKDFKYLYTTAYAIDQDVYLICNNNPYSEVRVKTLYDGSYSFPNLIKGNYKLYTYSDNKNGIASEIIRQFEITGDNQTVQIDSILVNKEKSLLGKATIRGIVKERVYDTDFQVLQSESGAPDKDVFMLIGESETISDDTETSANGSFEFNYLMPGKYRFYIYSEDSANHNTSSNVPVIKEINITSDDEIVDIGTFIKYKTVDYDEGTSVVKGVIGVLYYYKNFAYIVGREYAQDQEVYIVYNNRPYSETRIRTLYNGTYAFPNLIKGKYQIYTYSENTNNSGINYPVTKEFEIINDNQVIQIDSITVNKEI